MGLKHLDVTFDKIIIKWKSYDILKQIVLDGFYLPIQNEDGTVTNKYYQFFTSSAGQLRKNKLQMITTDMFNKIRNRIMCGLTYDHINAKGGINTSKILAYQALAGSSTDCWTDFDIDKVIVVEDYEANVHGFVKFINPDYTYELG